MQNLREIGSRYNGLQDALDAQKAALRGARDPQERRRCAGARRKPGGS